MREKYESLSVTVLRDVAKSRGLKHLSGLKKKELVELMLEEDKKDALKEKSMGKTQEGTTGRAKEKTTGRTDDKRIQTIEYKQDARSAQPRESRGEYADRNSGEMHTEPENIRSASLAKLLRRTALKLIIRNWTAESAHMVFWRSCRMDMDLSGVRITCRENDVYVSPSQIRRFGLKTGDIIHGNTRIKTQQEKFSALFYIRSINDCHPSEILRRPNFEDLTPIFPNERIRLETERSAVAMRIMDVVSPIGKGQRGMIVSPPKAGKTTLLKQVAKAVTRNNPEMHLIILLIDERPEEVTDIKEAIEGRNVEVIYSTFDELPEHHKRVSEMVIERARRLVEHNKDVMILLDSITRLARAYNLIVPPSGRTLSGGIDPAALHMPKRFFGAARNMREGGSITILATALVDTGSRMDDVVYEEFKGTGNMELILDRKLSERRIFPAVDITKSGTRREDLLLNHEEQEAVEVMRRAINGMRADEAVESILNLFVRTNNNREFCQMVKKTKLV